MTLPSSRKAAYADRQLKYFTNKPCKNGHLSDRYTRNGACIQCLRVANAELTEALALAPNDRRDSINQTAKMGMRIFHADFPRFAELAVAMTRARFPVLEYKDIVGNGKCTGDAAGTGFYPFRIHPDDVQMLRDVASAYCSSHITDRAATIAARIAAANEAADRARDNGVSEWKFT